MSTRPRKKRRWKQWTEREARTALDDWKSSGASAQTFARQLGVSPQRLAYWRQRFAGGASVAFVPVLTAQPSDARIEVERAGVVVRLRESIDPVVLAGIVAALARVEASC